MLIRQNFGNRVVCIVTLFTITQGFPALSQRATPGSANAAQVAFRDSADVVPPDWKGHRFRLSRDYPAKKPNCAAPWLKRQVSFTDPNPQWSQWEGYVQDIIDYVRQGQDADFSDDVGWRNRVGNETRWFHIPWMAFDGQRGREFVHGLTNELSTAESTFRDGRGSGKHQLTAAGDDPLFETWSVGMYNPCGAYAVGQVFPKSGVPAVEKVNGRLLAKGLPFPEGTVVVKVLNTTADASAVPYLKGSSNWQANGHVQTDPTHYSLCDRKVRTVHLVQIDLAVVDERSPTRWVYSTLAYNGFRKGATVWDRLQPLGVQWGSDPGVFPAVRAPRGPLKESIAAPRNAKELPEHLGCGLRLAGAVDQGTSSCISCHMGAFAAPPGVRNVQGKNIPAIFSFPGMCTDYNEANANYFSDYKYPARYPGRENAFPEAIPLDSSLQLAVAFEQYAIFTKPKSLPAPACPDRRSAAVASAR